MSYICHNGRFLPADEPVLLTGNRSYRYGDGLFETMRVSQGRILLSGYHFQRLFSSFSLLKYDIPAGYNAEKFAVEIMDLCKLNGCEAAARIRLSFSRGQGNLAEPYEKIEYIIECSQLAETNYQLNKEGLIIDIYPAALKTCDEFSNLKSASRLPYVMAAEHARENNLDDCLVLNTNGTIADSTIANIFIIKDSNIFTPSLSQGCVSGVMRRFIIERLQGAGHKAQGTRNKVQEGVLSITDLESADEVFLTNAIRGMQWVKAFRKKNYSNNLTRKIVETCFQDIEVDQSSNLGFTKLFTFDPKR